MSITLRGYHVMEKSGPPRKKFGGPPWVEIGFVKDLPPKNERKSFKFRPSFTRSSKRSSRR